MTSRLREAVERLERLQATLDTLAEAIAEPREEYRGPLEFLTAPTPPPTEPALPAVAHVPARRTARKRTTSLSRRTVRVASTAALPISLASALAVFGVLRLEPANTLWSQELTLSSSVGTGEFSCDPVTLQFAGLSHPSEDQTTLTYRLSGGGTNGPGCQTKDISNLSIGVCFAPEIGDGKPVLAETHPGASDSAWKYSPKNSSNPKLVKWDSKTESAPFGGKGPFDPDEMEFSFTVDARLTLGDLVDGTAKFKAGPSETDAGVVKVPACPLPVVEAAKVASQAAPEASAEPSETPTPAPAKAKATATPSPTPTSTPTATPTATLVGPRDVRHDYNGVAISAK